MYSEMLRKEVEDTEKVRCALHLVAGSFECVGRGE